MTLKADLMGLLMLAFATPALAAANTPSDPGLEPAALLVPATSTIPLVDCDAGSGSAFWVGPHLLMTALHVVNAGHCKIDGKPIHPIYENKALDYAILESDEAATRWLTVSCDGFQDKQQYLYIGHARGLDSNLVVPVADVGVTDDHYAAFVGILTTQPGQSGGPVIDALSGKVVGIVDAADWEAAQSYAVDLKDTPICSLPGRPLKSN